MSCPFFFSWNESIWGSQTSIYQISLDTTRVWSGQHQHHVTCLHLFWLKGCDLFLCFFGQVVGTNGGCTTETRISCFPFCRRQKNWTRNQGTYQMFSGSFDGTTSTGSCFLPEKRTFRHGNLRGPPNATPPRNKALLRDY